MAPITLSSKQQVLLRAYLEVSKTAAPDWTSIATKAEFPTAKYARDQFTIVKNRLLAASNGDPINLSDRQNGLLKVAIEVMKSETDWEKVASTANFKTPKYARDQWTIVRTKLCGGKGSNEAAGSTPNTPKKRKAGKASESRKRKKTEDDEDIPRDSAGEDDHSQPTPPPKRKKSHKVKVEETDVQEDNGQEHPITPHSSHQEDDVDTDCLLHDFLEGSAFEAEMFT